MFDPPRGVIGREKTQRQGLAVSAASWVPWMPCPARVPERAGLPGWASAVHAGNRR